MIDRETTAATTEIVTEIPTETTTETTVETTRETTCPIVTTKPREIVIDHKNAREILEEMTIEEKIGQVIFARYPTAAEEQMKQYKPELTVTIGELTAFLFEQIKLKKSLKYESMYLSGPVWLNDIA